MSSNPFETDKASRVRQAFQAESIGAASNALFGPWIDKNGKYFDDLKEDLNHADMDVLFRTYISKMLFYSFSGFIAGFLGSLTYVLSMDTSLFESLRYLFGIPFAVSLMIFGMLYLYPSQRARKRQKSIEENLPFALNHLAAIATSGIPPSSMFELLSNFDEYGGISEEAEKITRRVNTFGEDLTTALREVADRSPNDDWSDVLYGILSTVQTGGSMEEFLDQKAEEALFDYKMQREKEIERLSTYASFYTAILIAAPVFLVTILSVMNLLGGQVMGFAIRDLMWMGVHVLIPGLNIVFILFLGLKVN
ncbi:type II secretion system F family protein [Candidatus Nanohalococcus occultus]|uniref:type II secretion system F family protein n=1 Tax=Candidatus Nanohalococcus occultus TaxID=2978047 RepID=UPI0039E1C754